MSGRRPFLLDTNALSYLLNRNSPHHEAAQDAFTALAVRAQEADEDEVVLVPSLVLYEARRGMLWKGASVQIRELERFLRTYAWMVDFNEEAAEIAARLWADARRRNQTYGELDLMILAVAEAQGAHVITEDTGFPSSATTRLLRWGEVLASEE